MSGNIKLVAGTHTAAQDNTSSALTSGSTVAAATANIANATNLDEYVSAVLNGGFGSAPAGSTTLSLFLVPELDGSNFADFDTSNPLFALNYFVGKFTVAKSQTTAQRMALDGIKIMAYNYKAYLYNDSTAQTLSAGWTLDFYGTQHQYT